MSTRINRFPETRAYFVCEPISPQHFSPLKCLVNYWNFQIKTEAAAQS